jgi:predicted RND superfamily exporter protein
MIQGLLKILGYFLIAALVVTLVSYWYSRCLRATVIVISCSLAGVVWQLGIMQLLGFVLDPFSTLVPFLVFAIGVSHGVQMMNGTIQSIGQGIHRYLAARYTFRGLSWAGLAALMSDAAGFSVIYVIKIPVIQDLALQASMGVAVLIFTNLLLIPVILSYTGVSEKSANRAAQAANIDAGEHTVSRWFSRFTDRRTARYLLLGTALLTAVGFIIAQKVEIGDVGDGAPELHADSVYNQDIRYIRQHYGLSSDLFAIIVTGPEGGLATFETLIEMDRLEEQLRDLPFVQSVVSVASLARNFSPASFEGDPKWYTISRDLYLTNDAVDNVFTNRPGLINDSRSIAPIVVYLSDHKAQTLSRLISVVEKFSREHNSDNISFLLAAGNAGIEAATNEGVAEANNKMLALVYAVVVVLCFLAFRSFRAVLVAIIPLAVITILAQAMMVLLGIGLKVATLPVIALGVGIGVDYALYLLTVYLGYYRLGHSPKEAYRASLVTTGKCVALVGISLTVAVATWIWSPIKFQADMGMLLAFMFLGNMIGALVILPSLATFLLPEKKQ